MSERERSLVAVVLAAGQGARMRSLRPKPLHRLCGKPLLLYVVDTLARLQAERTVVVVGSGADRVTKLVQDDLADLTVSFVEQPRPRGTGDALAAALASLGDDDLGEDDVIVVPSDMPLVAEATLAALIAQHRAVDAGATVLSGRLADAPGRSRLVRGRDGRVVRVVPDVDVSLDPEAADSDEVAASVYVFRRAVLGAALRRLSPDNLEGEYRLSEVIEVLHRAGYRIEATEVTDPRDLAEVDDRVHLAEVEAAIRRRINETWLAAGVTMVDPSTCYVDATVTLGRDVTLFPNTLLQGRTVIGEGAEIGPDTRLVDCMVGAGAQVQKAVGRDAEVGPDAVVGPYVTLEPGAQVPPSARVESFTTVRMVDDQPPVP